MSDEHSTSSQVEDARPPERTQTGGVPPIPAETRPRGQPEANDPDPNHEVSLLQVVNVLLRRWRLVVGLPLGAALVGTVIALLLPPQYTATTSFVPESGSASRIPAGLAGLAGQFGLSLGADASQSPRFYADLLKGREIRDRVLRARYADARDNRTPGDSATLLQLLEVRGDDLADSLHNGRKLLEDLVGVRVSNQTNIVTVSVDSRYPPLAAAVANRFVYYLNEFNAKTRQSRARERRSFVQQQADEAERELRRIEEEIKTFYERNRAWQQSPQLVFEEGRLRRQVEIRQELYLTLKREYETARIEEVNEIPVITVIDSAAPPRRRSTPKRSLLIAVAVVIGGMAGVFAAFAADSVDRVRRNREGEYLEFRRLLARLREDVRGGRHGGMGQS